MTSRHCRLPDAGPAAAARAAGAGQRRRRRARGIKRAVLTAALSALLARRRRGGRGVGGQPGSGLRPRRARRPRRTTAPSTTPPNQPAGRTSANCPNMGGSAARADRLRAAPRPRAHRRDAVPAQVDRRPWRSASVGRRACLGPADARTACAPPRHRPPGRLHAAARGARRRPTGRPRRSTDIGAGLRVRPASSATVVRDRARPCLRVRVRRGRPPLGRDRRLRGRRHGRGLPRRIGWGSTPVEVIADLHTPLGLVWSDGDACSSRRRAGSMPTPGFVDSTLRDPHDGPDPADGGGEVNGLALSPAGRFVLGVSAPCDACMPTSPLRRGRPVLPPRRVATCGSRRAGSGRRSASRTYPAPTTCSSR